MKMLQIPPDFAKAEIHGVREELSMLKIVTAII